MLVYREISRAFFSCNHRFEIGRFPLLADQMLEPQI